MLHLEQFNFDLTLIFAILNGKVSASINRGLAADFADRGIDISPEQLTILALLWKKDRVSQQELCNATFKDKPSMTRLIDALEKKDMVKREADEKDRRNNLVVLTPLGRATEERAFLIANDTMMHALSNVTMEELTMGQNLLKKIFNNMQAKKSR